MSSTDRPYRELTDSELHDITETALSTITQLEEETQRLRDRIWKERGMLHELQKESSWRKLERSNWRPVEDGFYVVRTGEDTSEFYHVFNNGLYCMNLTTGTTMNWDRFPVGTKFKRFTTEDGYL